MAPAEHESLIARWGRRALTIPACVVLAALGVVLLPVLVPVALTLDVLRGPPLAAVRCVLFLVFYLVCEVLGLVGAGLAWLGSGVWAGGSRTRFLAWNYALQRWWAATIFAGSAAIFGLRTEVEGEDAIGAGPLLVFIRHTSVADALLPAVFLANRYGLRLRYVMRHALLWDPCVDVVGQRLPNVFVRHPLGESTAELALACRLAEQMGPGEGLLVHPEGARFTPERHAGAFASLARRRDTNRLARVGDLRHVLPPRLDGPLELLAARPDVDVLFVSHAGFDGVPGLRELWRGDLVGRTIRVCSWRAPSTTIPRSDEERACWLDEHWVHLDAWVDAQQAREAG